MALPKPQLNGDVLAYDETQTDVLNDIADYVVDSGSNPNGNWEKWASGKLIQRGQTRQGPATLTALDGFYRNSSVSMGLLPIQTVGIHHVTYSYSWSTNISWFVMNDDEPKTTYGVGVGTIIAGRASVAGGLITWKSIGRWK